MTDPTIDDRNAEIASLRANLNEYDRKLQAADRHQAETAKTHATIVHGLQAQLSDLAETHGNVLAKIAEAAGSKHADQPDRLIREVRLNRMHLTTYMEKGDRADRFEIAAADLLGLPKHAGQETILKAIRDLKTTAEKPRPMFIGVDFAAAGRDMALEINVDRLLDACKAPRRYEDGSLLTRQERIEWAIRRAPKT